jgi:thymidylate kinase
MERIEGLLEKFALSVQYPDVSGFELLELLDMRSKIAEQEYNLTEEERRKLEEADRCFLRNIRKIYTNIAQVANLVEVREKLGVSPSHWWWYLEELVGLEKAPA